MALGRNLKKKSLIPDEEKAPKKPSSKRSKPKSASKKTSAPKKSKSKTAAKAPEVATRPEAPKVAEASQKHVLRKDEFEKRHSLHQKFRKEVEELQERQLHLIVFEVGGEEFAIEIDKVDEVVVTPAITKMPHAPEYIPGLATIRGKGIVTLDLARKLGLVDEEKEFKERTHYTIVIQTQRFAVGLLVSNVPYNQMIAGSRVQSVSDSVSDTALDETYIKGLIRLSDRMIFFMDIDELVEGDRLKSRVISE